MAKAVGLHSYKLAAGNTVALPDSLCTVYLQ